MAEAEESWRVCCPLRSSTEATTAIVTKCQTGGCVNAARGMTQRDVERERDQWLRQHPGWCPAGETGAVAPC